MEAIEGCHSFIAKTFPFHIACDTSCAIVSFGDGVKTLLPNIELGSDFFDFFTIHRPQVAHSGYSGLVELQERVCWLSLTRHDGAPVLRGQWIQAPDSDMTFLGWPFITSVEDLVALRLDSTYFPCHHPMGDMLSMLETAKLSVREAETYAQELREQKTSLERMNSVLRERFEEQARTTAALERANFLLELRYQLAHILSKANDGGEPGVLDLLCRELNTTLAALVLTGAREEEMDLAEFVIHPDCTEAAGRDHLISFVTGFIKAPSMGKGGETGRVHVDEIPRGVFPVPASRRQSNGSPFVISIPVLEPGGRFMGWLLLLGDDPQCLETATLDFLKCEGISLAEHRGKRNVLRTEALQRMRMDAILDSSLDAIVTMSSDGRIAGWNGSAERTFGYPREEALHKTVEEILVPPALRHVHRCGMERYRRSGEGPMIGSLVETTALRRDGSTIPVEMAVIPFRLNQEEYFTATLRDLTDRKQAQERIEILARFPEDDPSPVLRIGIDGALLYANPAARVWGDMVPQGESEKVDPVWAEKVRETLSAGAALTEEWYVGGGHYLVRIIPASPEYVNLYATCIKDLKNRESQINELNLELEQRVEERTAALQETIRELESFTYSVSHDLRAPLRAVNGFSQFLLEDYGDMLPEGARDLIIDIKSNAAKMGRLIGDLLELSRLGQTAIQRLEVEPNSLVEQVLCAHRMDILSRKAKVTVFKMPPFEADPRLMLQVYENLIGNALKYARPDAPPEVEIGFRDVNGSALYYVRDRGIGFDMRFHDKIFDVFHRLHTNDAIEGTGVGLAIVRRIIEKHQGAIWAISEPQEGTTFYFHLGTLDAALSGTSP